ncbi:hypothetical protein D3C80_2125170 [compost metagenome]
MAEGGLGKQHASDESPHGHGQTAEIHEQGRAQHDQQRRSGHHLACLGFRQYAEHGVQQPQARGHQSRQHQGRQADTLP